MTLTNTFVTNPIIAFNYVFGNVVTNTFFTQTFVSQQTVTTGVPIGAPPGSSSVTTTNTVTTLENLVSGDYFLIPTNACGFTILTNELTAVTLVTNLAIGTNIAGGGSNSFTTFIFLTNHVLLASVPNCVAGTACRAPRH